MKRLVFFHLIPYVFLKYCFSVVIFIVFFFLGFVAQIYYNAKLTNAALSLLEQVNHRIHIKMHKNQYSFIIITCRSNKSVEGNGVLRIECV